MGAYIEDIENDPTFYSKEAMEWSNNDVEDEVASMSSNASTTSPRGVRCEGREVSDRNT